MNARVQNSSLKIYFASLLKKALPFTFAKRDLTRNGYAVKRLRTMGPQFDELYWCSEWWVTKNGNDEGRIRRYELEHGMFFYPHFRSEQNREFREIMSPYAIEEPIC